jgi:prevent-host-death family protein
MAVLRVGAEQLRRQLSEILARVRYGGEPVIVERHGTPQVVVIPYEQYEQVSEFLKKKPARPMSEDDFEQLMVEKGILMPRQRVTTPLIEPADRQLIETTGKPLSQVILEERR